MSGVEPVIMHPVCLLIFSVCKYCSQMIGWKDSFRETLMIQRDYFHKRMQFLFSQSVTCYVLAGLKLFSEHSPNLASTAAHSPSFASTAAQSKLKVC